MEREIKWDIRKYFQLIDETKHHLKGQKEFLRDISPELENKTKA